MITSQNDVVREGYTLLKKISELNLYKLSKFCEARVFAVGNSCRRNDKSVRLFSIARLLKRVLTRIIKPGVAKNSTFSIIIWLIREFAQWTVLQ